MVQNRNWHKWIAVNFYKQNIFVLRIARILMIVAFVFYLRANGNWSASESNSSFISRKEATYTGFPYVYSYAWKIGVMSNSLYYLEYSNGYSIIRKTLNDDSVIWIAAFSPTFPQSKSLTIDSSEEFLYVVMISISNHVLKLRTDTGLLISATK